MRSRASSSIFELMNARRPRLPILDVTSKSLLKTCAASAARVLGDPKGQLLVLPPRFEMRLLNRAHPISDTKSWGRTLFC
jgi:hypothetical protein